ncbi:M48 family metallopeptidase [Legionella sp. W05-934-2]|uniref:M48 family metallopeptidase n=1 Tax=Legionella sp. W05-934-2 TaxID=1198649 RepID=UPI003461FCA9
MNDQTTLDTGWCEVSVKRRKQRKSITILVKEGRVQVNAPLRMPAVDVQLLIENKRAWIERALAKQQTAIQETSKRIEPGELFLYQGKRYPLRIETGNSDAIYLSDDQHLTMRSTKLYSPEHLFERLSDWYRQQATAYLMEKTHFYAQKLGHFPSSIEIKSYRARWGSCSAKGAIHYNWRIIMAPLDVIDYVVVHELCHLVEHNHSSRFWQIVARFDKAYQSHRQWLKQYGDYLHIHHVKS